MKTIGLKIAVVFMLVQAIALAAPLYAAPEGGTPPGFEKGNKSWAEEKTPPGWEKGEKAGWNEQAVPPGLQPDSDSE